MDFAQLYLGPGGLDRERRARVDRVKSYNSTCFLTPDPPVALKYDSSGLKNNKLSSDARIGNKNGTIYVTQSSTFDGAVYPKFILGVPCAPPWLRPWTLGKNDMRKTCFCHVTGRSQWTEHDDTKFFEIRQRLPLPLGDFLLLQFNIYKNIYFLLQ